MITYATQRGNFVYIYKEYGVESACIPVSSIEGSGLKSFTSVSVNIQQGITIQSYDERGQTLGYPIYAGPTSVKNEYSGKNSNSIKHIIHMLIWFIIGVMVYNFLIKG